jgi:NAD(P)-dependent dehydrogenase (short-subunit alcohol dehydrogenase family)
MHSAKLVLITGCTRGLGRALARGLAARGWTVAGCGTDPTATGTLAAELGEPHTILPCDVSSTDAVERFAALVLENHGPPDLLLNNAAVINGVAPLWEVAPEDFARVTDINLNGIHRVCRAFVPPMIGAGRGVIVNFSSGWGRSTSPEVAPYCATKWAVEGLTQALAQELPRGLAAVALNPGIIDTDMLRSCWGEGAGAYPAPEAWAARAVPFLEKLGPKDNGRPLTVPGEET